MLFLALTTCPRRLGLPKPFWSAELATWELQAMKLQASIAMKPCNVAVHSPYGVSSSSRRARITSLPSDFPPKHQLARLHLCAICDSPCLRLLDHCKSISNQATVWIWASTNLPGILFWNITLLICHQWEHSVRDCNLKDCEMRLLQWVQSSVRSVSH